MKIEIGQTWESKTYPHEDFRIYDGVIDTCVDSFEDHTLPFEQQPEGTKIFFWRRINDEAFDKFVVSKKGEKYETTFPYAWCGECKKSGIINKIRKYDMKLK